MLYFECFLVLKSLFMCVGYFLTIILCLWVQCQLQVTKFLFFLLLVSFSIYLNYYFCSVSLQVSIYIHFFLVLV